MTNKRFASFLASRWLNQKKPEKSLSDYLGISHRDLVLYLRTGHMDGTTEILLNLRQWDYVRKLAEKIYRELEELWTSGGHSFTNEQMDEFSINLIERNLYEGLTDGEEGTDSAPEPERD